MLKLRHASFVLMMLWFPLTSHAQVSVGISFPNVSIGVNLPIYPQLVRVPDYPVYYAPEVDANYFFYEGMYWVFHGDDWYVSSWYNGPWGRVARHDVPAFILRIPVRYYRHPPAYFRGWRHDAPPRWGDHWGRDWERRRIDWDKWDRRNAPRPAPRPTYQRNYSGERYPQQMQRQYELQQREYRHQPRDPVVKRHYKQYQERGKGQGKDRDRDRDRDRH